ncbi:hypothetical protein Leryth_025139 [Lithospermum erythrorhizon]|nr:hypothetical protein Leryth_025139 [Lithospermum erythrorhizon]
MFNQRFSTRMTHDLINLRENFAGSIALKDYWEAGTIVFLFTTAEWLESRASHKASSVMTALINVVPQTAVIAETNEVVNVDKVELNTTLAIKAGETVPIDGVVVEGNCEMDEKTLTGESFPVSKQKDSSVFAGTINMNGYISIKTTAMAKDCVVARMAKIVEDAQNNKSKTQRFIDKCARFYTPAVIAISASVVIFPAALRLPNQKQWYRLALVVLVSACPCALILSTPVAMFCALSKAATSGLLFKGAEYLESLSKIKIIAFDKTGTITKGEFTVTDFRSLSDDVSLEIMLFWVSSIETKSSHPMAAAMIDYAHSHSIVPKPDKVEQFQNFPGEGIYGKIEEKDIYVGNHKIALKAGCATIETVEEYYSKGKSIGFIFLGSQLVGVFSLSDGCRTGVGDALKELKLMGIKTAMLTGDSNAAAAYAQNELGGILDEVRAELLPEDKATMIKEFQKESPTAMVGDGLNDAPALAVADIGISMGVSGSALATETGNVILMSNDIRKIPKAVRLGRRVRTKVIENMVLAISTKAAIVALAIAGHPLVWAAVLADVGTCLLVIFNSMLLLGGPHGHGKKCSKTSASHAHKHKSKFTIHRSSHNHQACCTEKTTIKETDGCTSNCHSEAKSSKCCQAKKSCSESTDKHLCVSHSSQLIHETEDHGQGSCNGHKDSTPCGKYDQGCLEFRNSGGSPVKYHSHDKSEAHCHGHDHVCLEVADGDETECANSAQRLCGCAADGEIHGENCDHIDHSDEVTHNHSVTASKVNHHHISNHGNQIGCCDNNSSYQAADKKLQNVVKKCCNGKLSNLEVHSRCKKECGAPVRSTINILTGSKHAHCNNLKDCSTLKKRQVGGCCRKECCPKNSHLGTGFRGSLNEIIIE